MNIIELPIELPSEEASEPYPECILWARSVCPVRELLCINWNEPKL